MNYLDILINFSLGILQRGYFAVWVKHGLSVERNDEQGVGNEPDI